MVKELKNYRKAFILLTSLFFMWGLITVLVDSLIPRLKEIFELSYFEAGLVQFAFFIAYGLVSIPAGTLLHRIGYKKGIILGLGVMGIGCLLFYPAADLRLFPLFMIGYFILASGMTILQVAANPYVTVLGDPLKASSRLNLSQAFNSLGTAIAPALGAIFILSDPINNSEQIAALTTAEKESYLLTEASAVQLPFLVLATMLILLAIIVLFVKLPKLLQSQNTGNYSSALKHKALSLGALGIFLYVGAEVTIGSYLVNYFLDLDLVKTIRDNSWTNWFASKVLGSDLESVDAKGIVGSFVIIYWTGAMVGRFIGSYLTAVFSPYKVLGVFAFCALLFVVASMTSIGLWAMFFILLVGLFNSIMFPTIFSIAIADLGELKPEGSGILCTAIAGGAFIPPLYGLVTDFAGFKWAFLLVILCYAYIFIYSRRVPSLILSEIRTE